MTPKDALERPGRSLGAASPRWAVGIRARFHEPQVLHRPAYDVPADLYDEYVAKLQAENRCDFAHLQLLLSRVSTDPPRPYRFIAREALA
jgi:hypothetical protein